MSSADVRKRAFAERLAVLRAEVVAGLPRRVAGIRTALGLLDKDEALARELVRTHAHRLQGIAGSYGLSDIGETAAQLSACAQLAAVESILCRVEALEHMIDELCASTAAVSSREQLHPALGEGSPDGSPVEPASAVGARVLAVDDEPSAAHLLSLTLTRLGGFDSTVLRDARDALARLQDERFDLIISDAMMPDMDGREFCRRARAADLSGRAKIVVLSAATPEELGWTSRDAAYDAWLRKPFRPQPLCWRLARLLNDSAAAGGPKQT